MKIEIRLSFKDPDDLNAWFNSVCTRCAFCNRDCGHGDPCVNCRADKVYKEWDEFFKKGDKK